MAIPPLPTVLLRHTTRQGVHYDWMVQPPCGDGRLWTARVARPSDQWASLGVWWLEVLPPHRRAYLRYQGPIHGDRGSVRRVDEGSVMPRLWTPHRMVLDVMLQRFAGRILLRRLTSTRWRAGVEAIS